MVKSQQIRISSWILSDINNHVPPQFQDQDLRAKLEYIYTKYLEAEQERLKAQKGTVVSFDSDRRLSHYFENLSTCEA